MLNCLVLIFHVSNWAYRGQHLSPALVQSLNSSNLTSTSYQLGYTLWAGVSAAAEQIMCKTNIVLQGHENTDQRVKQNPSNQRKNTRGLHHSSGFYTA